jgi:hypothetical protein
LFLVLLFLHCVRHVLRHRQAPGHTISTNTTSTKHHATANTTMITFTTVNNLRSYLLSFFLFVMPECSVSG